MDDGPTLEEIKAEEKESAKQATEGRSEEEDQDRDADFPEEELPDEVDDEVADPEGASLEDDKPSDDSDFSSMTVVQLKELLKEAGKPVSGKKADLISRLEE